MYVMIKPVSGLCNMRCSYCFYMDEMANRSSASYGMMQMTTLENILKKILDFSDKTCTILFQGGEPTLAGLDFYRECLRMEAALNRKNILISHAIQTNGLLLDSQWCAFLAQNHFLTGLSVDGVKATHDAYRKDAHGRDTYLSVLQAARMLQEAGVEWNILTVVNARTASKIRRIYESYKKLGFLWQQYIACLEPVCAKRGEQDYSLTPAGYGRFLIELFELWYLDLQTGTQPYIRQFENYVGILMGQVPESCEQRGVCGFQCTVEADGSVYPCDFYCTDSYRLGNLNADSFEEIITRLKEQSFIQVSASHTQHCRECAYWMICRGGCRRHREQTGILGENYFCESYKMFFDACLPRLRKIAAVCMRR